MNLYGPEFFTDDQLAAEIRAYAVARRKVTMSGIAVIAGEGRRVEFTDSRDSRANLDNDLRNMMAEARRRNMPIGGRAPSAIAVEVG